MALSYLIYNGEIYSSDAPIITANNRSFRYGDGCFETIKMIDGNIVLQHLHWERLFASLQILQFELPDSFTPGFLLHQIKNLTQKNNHEALARIRITIFRGEGDLYNIDNSQPNYIIQSWALESFPTFSEQGFVIDVYNDACKQTDAFSPLKTNNYLPYAMAAIWCKKNNLNDAVIMNSYHSIAEATTSNVFIVKNNVIKTPFLGEGCIAGVVRSHLLSCTKKAGILYEETTLTSDDLLDADEVFLTNAGWYIQWVKRFRSKVYTNETSKFLYQQFITPLLTKQ